VGHQRAPIISSARTMTPFMSAIEPRRSTDSVRLAGWLRGAVTGGVEGGAHPAGKPVERVTYCRVVKTARSAAVTPNVTRNRVGYGV